MDGTKLYHFTLKIGEARDTDDADGAVTATSADVRPTDDAFEAALPAFRGAIMQVPPPYSGHQGRRRTRLRHGPRGPGAGAGGAPRAGGSRST